MRTIGRLVYVLALALWVGGGVSYTFVMTPAIFAAYTRTTAGDIVGTMMPHYFAFLLAASACAALVMPALWRVWPRRRRALCLGLVLVALLVQSFVLWRLYPQILEVKSRVTSFDSSPDTPERRRFRSLHGISMLLNLFVIANGAVLLALAIRPDQGEGNADIGRRFPK